MKGKHFFVSKMFCFVLLLFAMMSISGQNVYADQTNQEVFHNYVEFLETIKTDYDPIYYYNEDGEDFRWPSETIDVDLGGKALELQADWVVPENVT